MTGPFSRYFKGRLAHVALFSAALIQSELTTIYNGGEYGEGAGSILVSNDSAGADWLPPGAEGDVLTIVGGTPT